MADKSQQPNQGVVTNTFTKGMVKDYNETFIGEGLWTHARNAVSNSYDGQLGVIGNEPSNLHCVNLPYTLIGCIHVLDDQWVLFTTDDVNSEIGLFDESACSYKKIINDPCLNFKRSNLITGVFRKRYDCERIIYWDDALNPTRMMDIDNVPFVCINNNSSVGGGTGTVINKYKVIAATCPSKTSGTTVEYTDQNYKQQSKSLLDGEVFEFVTYEPSKTRLIDKKCEQDPCYKYNVRITIPTASATVMQLCLTDKQAFDQQFPNGQLNALTSVYAVLDSSNNKIPCGCLDSLNTTLTASKLIDITNTTITTTGNDCNVKICTDRLDCEKIRVAPHIKYPCVTINKGKVAGTLPNGSYQACIAYTVNNVRVTDYIGLSEVQGLFSHMNTNSSLEIQVTNLDDNYDEFELVLLTNINAQSVAKRIGYYSASQGTIYVDRWDLEYVTVPTSQIVVRTEPVEKSDAMYSVNNYLLRVGVHNKFKFNYQQQANKIQANWLAIKYPATYYVKGGNNTGYMRDEQYAFFIRFIYNTGEKSESYHIPGRAPLSSDLISVIGQDAFETLDANVVSRARWQVENTAIVDSLTTTTLGDGGVVIASGKMGYWESAEKYPDDKPNIWGDLCGKNIRHHKMPDESVHQNLSLYNNVENTITILGVQFNNITAPLDNSGNPIESIVGYEILRGSREGNKTILAKGLINNMREYSIPGQTNSSSGIQGLYQNYPYNDLREDSYLTPQEQTGVNGSANVNSTKLSSYKKNVFSFHSPETTFTNPYISVNEVKIYQELYGTSTGRFTTPYKHPKFKFPTNFSDILTKVIAVVAEINKIVGSLAGADMIMNLQGSDKIPLTSSLIQPHRSEMIAGSWFGLSTGYLNNFGVPGIGGVAASKRQIANTAITVANVAVLTAMAVIQVDVMSEQLMKLIIAIIPARQYAAQYISHGFYNNSKPSIVGNRRRKVEDSVYVRSSLQTFTSKYQVNNINRSGYVIFKTSADIDNPTTQDTSRFTIGEKRLNLETNVDSTISAHYAALKLPMVSQYGQLQYIKQLPVSTCIGTITPDKNKRFTSDIIFGGDVYVNRFTEKNTMFFFNTWLMGEPNETEIDYSLYANIPYPRFWVNNTDLSGGLFKLTSSFRALDYRDSATFHINRGYFYLFNSGVRDFYVESEINLAYRDWDDEISKIHYDNQNMTDLSYMFRSDVITSGNYYKYDYSLSVSKLFNSHISWGNILAADYDPNVSEKCYVYRPNRVIYSLPQQDESKQDAWRIFLTNNYKDFKSKITSVKPVNKTGALFMMKYMSPLQFMGIEELKLDATGAKITIGDGELFSDKAGVTQQLQAVVNADESFEYGSCQNKNAVTSTPYGIFWVSQNQGKIFNYGGKLDEITKDGMRWWFANHLPSELIKQYSEYPLYDNPVKGVGVQLIYDNTNEILYITKKDYKPKEKTYAYDDNGNFYKLINNVKTKIELTDPVYFENASWTISYDPKSQMFLSFHDWIPTFLLPSKTHFLSVNVDSIWKHNVVCNSYCNFYNKDYPFEVEFVSATGQTVNSVRSVEYLLEAYRFHNDCSDKFHVHDVNFDHAIVYNSEQISGLLELELKSKSNPLTLLSYPQIGPSSIKINYSKEEHKYRFNQFWDITKDRGEFNTSVNVPMFITEPNGYKFQINPTYVNYNKPVLERKKFRHNTNKIFLRKLKNGDLKILFKISNEKILQSPR